MEEERTQNLFLLPFPGVTDRIERISDGVSLARLWSEDGGRVRLSCAKAA